MRTSLLSLVLLVACSSAAPPLAQPAAPANKCAFVADHLLSLLTATAKDAPGEELDRVRTQFNQRCNEDAWSAEAQQCFLELTAKEDVDRCAAKLTEAQRAALNQPPEPPQ